MCATIASASTGTRFDPGTLHPTGADAQRSALIFGLRSSNNWNDGFCFMSNSKTSDIKSICVLCGAKMGDKPQYAEMARQVAELFHRKNWTLVYGASSEGLMGVLARQLDSLGGKVHGVKAEAFLKYEPSGCLPEVGENEIVPDLHTQKVRMVQLSNAFLFLPGGFGTFEELSTFRMWHKLEVHALPMVIFNFEGYYDLLLKWFNAVIDEGFASPSSIGALRVINDLKDLEVALTSSN